MAKHTFDVCFNDDKVVKTYQNTQQGITSFFRIIDKLYNTPNYSTNKLSKIARRAVHIGIESTSHYHMLLCMRAKTKGYNPILINPLITNKYSQTRLRKAKTDKIDARIIRYCTIQKEGYEWKETKETITIKHFVRERESLAMLKNICKLRKEAIISKSNAIGYILPTAQDNILETIQEQIKETEKKLKQYRTKEQKLLQTIPGVGPLTAIACISEIQDITRFKRPKYLIAFIGIDPKVHQSGISIDKYRRITKRGSKILRTRLYNATSVAVLHNNQFKTYFQKKKDQGKPYRVALVATMNKMARVIHSVWTNNKPYQEPQNR